MECGELFLTTVDGTSVMHKSHVDNWDILLNVSYSLYKLSTLCIHDIKYSPTTLVFQICI